MFKKIKAGQLARIKNKDRKLGAATHYNQFTIKSLDGKQYESYLATDHELAKMKNRAEKNTEDILPLDKPSSRYGKFRRWLHRGNV